MQTPDTEEHLMPTKTDAIAEADRALSALRALDATRTDIDTDWLVAAVRTVSTGWTVLRQIDDRAAGVPHRAEPQTITTHADLMSADLDIDTVLRDANGRTLLVVPGLFKNHRRDLLVVATRQACAIAAATPERVAYPMTVVAAAVR